MKYDDKGNRLDFKERVCLQHVHEISGVYITSFHMANEGVWGVDVQILSESSYIDSDCDLPQKSTYIYLIKLTIYGHYIVEYIYDK